MKTTIIKTAACIAALLGLLLVVADMPDAGLLTFTLAKAAGLAVVYSSVKLWEKHIPDETI